MCYVESFHMVEAKELVSEPADIRVGDSGLNSVEMRQDSADGVTENERLTREDLVSSPEETEQHMERLPPADSLNDLASVGKGSGREQRASSKDRTEQAKGRLGHQFAHRGTCNLTINSGMASNLYGHTPDIEEDGATGQRRVRVRVEGETLIASLAGHFAVLARRQFSTGDAPRRIFHLQDHPPHVEGIMPSKAPQTGSSLPQTNDSQRSRESHVPLRRRAECARAEEMGVCIEDTVTNS
ncbi:hypothetical protein QJS10_CPA05g01628 [Acorus calamus]|uniref:Uncharacterized protein n=1 Tax=Acorus calamus TaxID=4465 RepID=A0AAV9EST1_ACOCL|nr:hypothetical protein QJS10_CPA05g01628 [Acorus calamus]